MLIEIHMLKNYPATNLNRDETGSPKTCYFGGSQRGRISSQCMKRSWRTSNIFDELGSKGYRSRNLPELVGEELLKQGVEEEYIAPAKVLITGIANKDQKTNDKEMITGQMIFFSPDDIAALTEKTKELIEESESVKTFKKVKPNQLTDLVKKANARAITLDIALFGRMVTSDAFVNVEASMQVAHAVSTHPVNLESDYYTAVDDLIQMKSDATGAGMIGDIDYDSCCYYQYAALDMDKLKENLKDSPETLAKVEMLIPVLLKVMAQSNPSGKQNSFAGHVFPEAMMVEFKDQKVPLSYVNAYAEPVSRFSKQIVRDSIEKLVREVDMMDDYYALPIRHRAWMAMRSEAKPQKAECFSNFNQMLEKCEAWSKE